MDSRDITRRAIAVLREGDAAGAAALKEKCAARPDCRAEELMLENLSGRYGCAARLGALTFSFPRWRFLTQGHDGAALAERFGMRRLTRPADLRDASLPDPARDEFGTGFFRQQGGICIEYRRAYLLCADTGPGGATLVIRNSSYFFGRDRLAWPVYCGFGAETPESLQALAPQDFLMPGRLAPWREDMSDEQLERIRPLVARLDDFDAQLHRWLLSEGLTHLQSFLRARLAAGRGMPWLGQVAPGMPPWFPLKAVPLSAAAIEGLAGWRSQPGFTLLSGPEGDLPAV